MEKYPGYLRLLKWSLAQNDGTHPTEFKPLTDEEKAFLKGAMAELTFDPHKLAKECIRVVNLPDNPALDPPDEPAAEGKGGEDGAAAGAATSTSTSLGSGSGAGAGAGAGAAPAATAVDGDSAPRDAGTTTGGADASGGAETAATPDAAATSAEVGSGVAVSGEVAPGSGADAAGVSGGADADAGTASSDTPVTTLAVGGAVASASASGRPPVTFEERRVAKEEALQTLLDYVADHDNAQLLHELGGMLACVVTLRSNHASLRALAYEVLGLCCRHKATVQLQALQLGVLDKAMEALVEDPEQLVRTKALYCLSGLLSDSPVAQRVFGQRGGWRAIVAAMQSAATSQRMQRKAVFFCLGMTSTEENAAAAAAAGAIPALAQFVTDDHVDLREHSQAALVSLLTGSAERTAAARDESLGLLQKVQGRLEAVRAMPEEERMDYEPELESLLQLVALLQ